MNCSHDFMPRAVWACPAWHRHTALHSKGSAGSLGCPVCESQSYFLAETERKGKQEQGPVIHGQCMLPAPTPIPSSFSKARHTPNKGANSVRKQRSSWSKCSVSAFFCPCKVRKVLSDLRDTVPIVLPCQGCP